MFIEFHQLQPDLSLAENPDPEIEQNLFHGVAQANLRQRACLERFGQCLEIHFPMWIKGQCLQGDQAGWNHKRRQEPRKEFAQFDLANLRTGSGTKLATSQF